MYTSGLNKKAHIIPLNPGYNMNTNRSIALKLCGWDFKILEKTTCFYSNDQIIVKHFKKVYFFIKY